MRALIAPLLSMATVKSRRYGSRVYGEEVRVWSCDPSQLFNKSVDPFTGIALPIYCCPVDLTSYYSFFLLFYHQFDSLYNWFILPGHQWHGGLICHSFSINFAERYVTWWRHRGSLKTPILGIHFTFTK